MKTVYLFFLTLVFASCSLSNPSPTCTETRGAAIETVVEKPNADVSKHMFDVAFRVDNGCGALGSFEQVTVGNVTTIYVIALYDGCICTQETPLRTAVYTFNQSVPGTYTLIFKLAGNNTLSKTVVVQ